MKNLNEVMQEFNKKAKGDIMTVGIPEVHYDRIPFSSPQLNYMTYGGLPRNSLVEFSGSDSSGKSSLALDVVKNAQKLFSREFEDKVRELSTSTNSKDIAKLEGLQAIGEKKVLYVDAENTLIDDWVNKFDIDVSKLIVVRPEYHSADELFQLVREAIQTGEIGLAIFDSFGAVHSEQQFNKEVGEQTFGGIARALTTFSKFLIQDCKKYNCTFIGLNQLRENLSSPYGGTLTIGGRGWSHNCVIKLALRHDANIDEKGAEVPKSYAFPHGQITKITFSKNKLTSKDRGMQRFTISSDVGIDHVRDTVDFAVDHNIINKSGAWFTYVDKETGEIIIKAQGFANLKLFFLENSEMYDKLKKETEVII